MEPLNLLFSRVKLISGPSLWFKNGDSAYSFKRLGFLTLMLFSVTPQFVDCQTMQ